MATDDEGGHGGHGGHSGLWGRPRRLLRHLAAFFDGGGRGGGGDGGAEVAVDEEPVTLTHVHDTHHGILIKSGGKKDDTLTKYTPGGGGGGGGKNNKMKTVTWASAALPKYRKDRKVSRSPDAANGKLSLIPQFDISLIQASRDGLVDVVEAHLESHATNIHDYDEDGFTAVHHAARYNRVKVLEVLLLYGADVNIKGGQDELRPLHMACRYNSGTATQVLLTHGAMVNVPDIKGKTPLHYATRRGHDMVTKMLLSSASCDVNAVDSDRTTPLIMAAMQGNTNITDALISRGADITKVDVNDMTALMWASCEGHANVVSILLKAAQRHGDASARHYVRLSDNEGSTALHLAVQNGSRAVCELLLEQNADVNSQKLNLATPLHVAATCGFEDIAELLIRHGGEVNKGDIEQMTPVHKASLYNKVDLIRLLMKHGGNINSKDKKNMAPLHHACWKGQQDAVEFLLDNGAQIAEADSSLKTPLHWAVQFGHYETLLVLLKKGGSCLLEASDKNDQTVLHYAAYIGNVSVLTTLLDHGANTGAKDQEERTPLHIAAQYDNMSCVETLIERCNHETNDDDVDGRTPLLLACMYGHAQVVAVLLSLGADVSKRDDEHCTSLMLSAARGHTTVMKILLDHQANVNEVDKMKNTALHYACCGGHSDAVQTLLDKRADVTLKNTFNQTPLEMAIDYLHSETATIMLKHKSWRDSMSMRDAAGMCPLEKLIEKLPDVALVVLDHCVERSSRDDDDPTLSMVFDYQYIDPGPDDPACVNKRYFALNTMVLYDRDTLLSHPLCQNILSQKWVRFGRQTFYVNLMIYLGYLVSLTCYVNTVDQVITTELIDDVNWCPIYLNDSEKGNQTLIDYYKKHGQDNIGERLVIRGSLPYMLNNLLFVFIGLFLVRECMKCLYQRLRYFFNFFNWIAWILMASTFAFTYPAGMVPCLMQWRAGWIALFLAWINFIMYLRRIDFVGIYVIMFVTVLVSLLKAILVFFFFSWAFAGSFYIVMSNEPVFNNTYTSFLNTFVMALGEIEYVDNYLPRSYDGPFVVDANILLFVFLFLMPIVLMNLMIGIAVGDIEKIQHNAYMRRIALQVDLLYQFENTMPRFLARRTYIRRATVKPNEGKASVWDNLRRYLFGSTRNVQFIQAEVKDRGQSTMERMAEEVRQQAVRQRGMAALLAQQEALLQQIAAKLDVAGAGGPLGGAGPDQVSVCPPSDSGSHYDNISFSHRRTKSIRDHSTERPHSLLI